jgi:hypothetical protein
MGRPLGRVPHLCVSGVAGGPNTAAAPAAAPESKEEGSR